ncbi:MAG: amidotransferase 1, exosortase A system-associated [Betaproteobacteria bacterium]|nr:amidotransferase 1, exosortase A system-associated [Betaproteobacteria bacterium]
MCGIVGIFDSRNRSPVSRGLLERMNERQFHRGPDEGGIHLEPGIGLGHRRLSIIDLSTGQQPLFNENGSVAVVFNGEIYNFQELVPELQALGHTFRTRSDTEVIVHGWEAWGPECVKRFRGMFAFAIWDRNRDTLFLARDRMGVKPLHYSVLANGTVLFASEIKGLLAVPSLDRTLDPLAVEEYFAYGYAADPRSIFKSVRKLPPACTLTIRRGAAIPDPHCYWDLPFKPSGPITEGEAREELTARLKEAVRIRLMSEVPLGAFLSGGVDSSAVVAMMAKLSGEPVNTCSIAFGDPAFNETQYAQVVADRYHTHHQVEQVDPDDFDLVDRLASLYDEPYADSSAIPTYKVCELARKRVIVALSGDGGDENFAGYRRYKWHMKEERIRSMLPLPLRRSVFGLLGQVYPKADWAPRALRAKTTFQALARDSVEAYFHSVSIMRDDMRKRLFSDSFRRTLGGYDALEVLRHHARRAPTEDPLSLIQYLDIKTYLVGDILTKVDRASMAHSLEVREPLLDHPMMEWLSSLPSTFKLGRGEGKLLFKEAMEPYLPDDILYRPKMGFAVPLAGWFRGPLRARVRESLLGPTLAQTGYFDRRYLQHLVEQHEKGFRDYSAPIWSLLMFDSFLRSVLGHETSTALQAVG